MRAIVSGLLLVSSLSLAVGELINLFDQETFESFGFTGIKPKFRKPLYKTCIYEDDIMVELTDESIVLENCNTTETNFEFSIDTSRYFVITNPAPASPMVGNCTVMMTNIYKKNGVLLDVNAIDVITLRAIQYNYIVAETILTVFNATRSKNVYSLTFQYAGRDYIGLDYGYFKTFVWILMFTGLAIVLLEFWEIYVSCRVKSYSKLEEV